MRNITHIAVHCSATPEGRPHTVKDIDRWHRARGFRCIGYHFVIYLDGSVHVGRPLEEAGAHVEGHNATSIGICYIGGVSANDVTKARDTRTPAQKAALLQLLTELKGRFPKAVIQGHRDFPRVAKACPCFDAKSEYAGLQAGGRVHVVKRGDTLWSIANDNKVSLDSLQRANPGVVPTDLEVGHKLALP